jgi:hypothetical protein
MSEHYDDVLVQDLAMTLSAVVNEYLGSPVPSVPYHPDSARMVQARRVLDRLIELGWRPSVDCIGRRDEHGIVSLEWPQGRGPVLMAPEMLEELNQQLNESRKTSPSSPSDLEAI